MKLSHEMNTWIINAFLLVTCLGLIASYIAGVVLAFIEVAQ